MILRRLFSNFLSYSALSSSYWAANCSSSACLSSSARLCVSSFSAFNNANLSSSKPAAISNLRARSNTPASRIRNSSLKSFFASRSCISSTSNARLSFSTPSRVKTCTSITVPVTEFGTRKELSLTSDAFSPKIARSSFSSGVNCVSPFGVTLPTRISPLLTSAPI